MVKKAFRQDIVKSKANLLSHRLVLDLADRLDPPEIEEVTWVEPPDIIEWGQTSFIDPTTERCIVFADHQIRLLRAIFKLIWEHKVNTIVWSEIKKSGKTAIAGLVGAYWGSYIEAPNEIITVANDQEQSQGRIYAAMVPTLKKLGWSVPERMPLMENKQNGSAIKAIGTNYSGEAGGNPGLTLWSELWAFTSESRKRLFDELTHVPTRKYSIRWVETYAGFLNESDLLWDLYSVAFKDGKETEPLGERIDGVEDLPIWYIPESKTVVYWSHTPRMPWQTTEFIDSQRNAPGMRPATFRRLWCNEWVSSEDQFITLAMYDALENCEPLDEQGDNRILVLGADASVANDSSAVIAATWDRNRKAPDIIAAWEWRPKEVEGSERTIVNLSKTVKDKVKWLIENFTVEAVYYDEYQLHSIMTDLKEEFDRLGTRKLFVDFPQNSGRIESDQALYNWINLQQLRVIKHPRLKQHMLNAVARETERGFRLDKESTSQKIDLAVASAMACYGASVRNRAPRKFVKV